MPLVTDQRPDATAHHRMVHFLHDFGFEWAAFYSRHKSTPEMSTDHEYLLARDIFNTAQHIATLLPYFATHWRWQRRVPAEEVTTKVFTTLLNDHRMDSVCARRARKSPIFVMKNLRDWCIRNMPWRPLAPVANGTFRIMPNTHLDTLQTLRYAATRCFLACKRAVPPERRATVERPSAWKKYFARIFPTAPLAWKPHLEAFLWKYPVDLIKMLGLNEDSDYQTRKVPFTCATAITDIEMLAAAATYLQDRGGCSAFSGCSKMYTHLTGNPWCLRLACSNFPLPLRPTARPNVFTAPYPVYLGEAVSYVDAPHDNRAESEQLEAFWEEAIRRCAPNEVVVTLEGADIYKETETEIRIPPAIAREAAVDLQALADALKRAVSDARAGVAPAPVLEEDSDVNSSVYDSARTASSDATSADDSEDD